MRSSARSNPAAWSVTRLEAGATEQQVASAAATAGLLHFSGHAESRPERPARSGLFLTPDGEAADLTKLGERAGAWHRLSDGSRWADVDGTGRLYERPSPSGSAIERWLERGATSTLWSGAEGARVAELWTAGDITVSRALGACGLVVLSACASGVSGLPTSADEHGGLAAALQLAGAGTVVATLWPVYEDAAALFVATFYDTLAHTPDGDVAAAVHAARERLRTITAAQARAYFETLRESTSRPLQRLALEACAAALADGPEYPYADPQHHAAFFATGSGLITLTEVPHGDA